MTDWILIFDRSEKVLCINGYSLKSNILIYFFRFSGHPKSKKDFKFACPCIRAGAESIKGLQIPTFSAETEMVEDSVGQASFLILV